MGAWRPVFLAYVLPNPISYSVTSSFAVKGEPHGCLAVPLLFPAFILRRGRGGTIKPVDASTSSSNCRGKTGVGSAIAC